AVEAEAAGIACHAERSRSDEPRAEQRRRLGIGVLLRQRETVPFVRDGQLRVAAVDLISGEPGAFAQVLAVRAAIDADAAGPSEPWDADPGPPGEPSGAFFHDADDLVSRHQGVRRSISTSCPVSSRSASSPFSV